MLPARFVFCLCFSTVAILAVAAAFAAGPQDPFQKAEPPGGNADGTGTGKSSSDSNSTTKGASKAKNEPEFIWKSDDEWRQILTYEQYVVTRLKGTEPAFTGKYSHGHFRGTFLCVCCGAELFDARTKYESGTGWPSFWQPISDKAVTYAVDNSEAEVRVEVNCRRCGAHLGHVFGDGPPPTGRRFCMNSVALKLRPLGGTTANNSASSKSRRARTKSKTTLKTKTKSKSPSSSATKNPPTSTSPTANGKGSDQSHQASSAASDQP